jgi:hypothetical protein
MRFCVDYRRLKEVTIPESYRLPAKMTLWTLLEGLQYSRYSTFPTGFTNYPWIKPPVPKTAISTRRGLYQWTIVPFGILNGSPAFQGRLDSVLAGLTFECCFLYLDDIVVYSKSSEQHMDALNKVLTALRDSGLKLAASTCSCGVNRVTYLGHIICKHGIEVDPDKLQAVRDFSVPRNTTEVREFHGLCNYFR